MLPSAEIMAYFHVITNVHCDERRHNADYGMQYLEEA